MLGLALALVTLAVYWQVGAHDFVNFDDRGYIQENLHVSTGLRFSNIAWAFTSLEVANWHPLTWLSHMLDVQLYGLNAGGHHISSVVIHAAAAVLLLLLLYRLTGAVWQSALVAALFALHPMHVESVAWVAERKDVLSAFFWFLTLLLYAGYASTRRRSYYLLTLLSFALGLMAKPMLVTLPLVMLLLDVWPLKRVEGLPSLNRWSLWLPLVKEKIPFFVLSLLSAAITIYAQGKGGAINSEIALWPRIENAVIAAATYMVQMLWPHDMAFFYPLPAAYPAWKFLGSTAMLALLTAWVLRARRRYPFLAMGWFWFLITLAPVIGLVRVGAQSMADRYTYIPYTGLFIMLAWGVPELTRRLPCRQLIHGLLAALALCVFIAVTWQQIGYWRDGITLFRHALQVTDNNNLAHNNLGIALAEQGDLAGAIQEYRTALAAGPDDYDTHGNLGLALAQTGDLAGAINEYRVALAIKPDYYDAHNNLGIALVKQGDLDAAMAQFHAALAQDPNRRNLKTSLAHNNLGAIYARKNKPEEAIREYRAALAINPAYYDAHNNLGIALAGQGALDAAARQFQAALALKPREHEAHNNLGVVLAEQGRQDGAIRAYRQALAIRPGYAAAHYNLGLALTIQGDAQAALREFRDAVRLDPESVAAQRELAAALGSNAK